MCGILGFSGKENLSKINILLDLIEHRGRDERVFYYDSNVNFGMNRLSIIDLKKNIYPVIRKNCTLIFNGEIYNYKKIKSKLIKKGYNFNTNSDSEVILPMYELYGMDFLKYLDGMFAIAIFDKSKNEIILSRDKFGEKPLYFSQINNELYFSSEVKVLLKCTDKVTISNKGLNEYLSNGFVGEGKTVFNSIEKLRPGEYLKYNVDTKEIIRFKYFSINSLFKDKKIKNNSNVIKKLIKNSVESRLLSDVPVGIFLSGGIDSSLIAYYAKNISKISRAYTVSFFDLKFDELKYSKYVSDKLGLKLTIINCTAKSIKEIINNIGNSIDEPISDPAFIPTYLMAKRARKDVKVVLSGEGADEFFLGYRRYLKEFYIDKLRNNIFIKKIKPFFGKFDKFKKIYSTFDSYYKTNNIWSNNDLKNLLEVTNKKNIISNYSHQNNVLNKMQIIDINNYLPEQLLMKIDKSTMLNNLESRSPFLNISIAKYALNLRKKDLLFINKNKIVLKKIASEYFGKKFAWRRKHGFELPLGEWFRKELKENVDESLILCKKYKKFFNYSFYKKIVDQHMSCEKNNYEKIWNMIVILKVMEYYEI